MWQTYNQYFADNAEALKRAGYGYGQTGTDLGVGSDWSDTQSGENPYRFMNEYNQYLSDVPEGEQAFARAGIRPAYFLEAEGAIGDEVRADPTIKGATQLGTGSSSSLDPTILSKMWR